MGMFRLIRNAHDYTVHASEFKRQYNLSPFTLVSSLGPSKYPCLVGFLKVFEKSPTKLIIDGAVRIIYKEAIINEIYYRSQAKELVYPSKARLTRPKSTKITSTADLDRFIAAFWYNYYGRYGGNQTDDGYALLQNHQVDELCANVYAEVLPCIVSAKEVNMANSLIYVTIFPVLTVEEAKSLVYYKKNIGPKRKLNHQPAMPFRGVMRTSGDHGDHIPF